MSQDTITKIDELVDNWVAAERTADTKALAELLSEDFRAIGPRGFMLDKAQWLQRYESGDLVNEAFTLNEVQVRTYATTAVVNGVQDQTATHQGHPASGRFRATLVAVSQENTWKVVNIQLSPMVTQG